MKTNVHAMFRITEAAVPHRQPGSTIINASSIQAYQPPESLLDHVPAKAAIDTFSKAVAQQPAPQGIRLNVVAPGPIWTPLQTAGGQPPEALPPFGDETPLAGPVSPRRWRRPSSMAASGESSYVTGATVRVNGGMPTP